MSNRETYAFNFEREGAAKELVYLSGLEIFLLSCGVGFSGAIMPGPLLTVNIRETLKRGFWAGPQIILGHAMLEGLLILGLVFGLGDLIKLETSKGVISLLGGAFLFWMAYGMIFREGKEGLNLSIDKTKSASRLSPTLAGVLISLSNPYWSIWWATLGLGFLAQAQELGTPGVLLFFSGHILADLLWYSAISFAVSKGRKVAPAGFFRGLTILCGLFLVYLSLDFLWLGIETLEILAHLRRLI